MISQIKNTLVFLILLSLKFSYSFAQQYDTLKIAPHPNGGIYIGQYEWSEGADIDTMEAALGRHVGLFTKSDDFSQTWENGRVGISAAIEAVPIINDLIPDFTVDKLLTGEYDSLLNVIAFELAEFSKPLFFTTAREPNGVLSAYFGGFGVNGDMDFEWALENNKGLAEFDPSVFPNNFLYADLGDSLISDGVERLVAAHRYYYHFFKTVKGLDFLTFDTMGWGANHTKNEWLSFFNTIGLIDNDHDITMILTSFDFRYVYPGNEYVDWVSLTMYISDEENPETDAYINNRISAMDSTLMEVQEVAPDKPIIFVEVGFPDSVSSPFPYDKNSAFAAKKLSIFFEHIIQNYPQINGVVFWTDQTTDINPGEGYNYRIYPNTIQADTMQALFERYPDYFHSCVYFSDGSKIPGCSQLTTLEEVDRKILKIEAHPNPCNEFILLSNADHFTHLDIVDIYGKKIEKTRLSTNPIERINVSHLPNGVYIFRFTTQFEEKTHTEKVIVLH